MTQFITTGDNGLVAEVNLTNGTVSKQISLLEDQGPDSPSSSKGFPNLLSAVRVEPAGKGLWVGGYKSNSGRGTFRSGEHLNPFNTVRGYLGRIDLEAGSEQLNRRIDPNNADSISAIEFSPNGRFAFVAHQGAETVSIYDIMLAELVPPGDGSSVPFLSRLDVGFAPQGLATSSNGQFLYVQNYLGRNVTQIDVSDPAKARVISSVSTTQEPLTEDVANGKRLFHRSKAPRHSKDTTSSEEVWNFILSLGFG